MANRISAIFIVDELPYLEGVPWREAAASALAFVDEMIVVHGDKRDPHGRRPTWEYFEGLSDPRIRLLSFPWPHDFDWTQIARTAAFGQIHATGDWCFRLLVDEVFPDEFQSLPGILAGLPERIGVVSVWRHYLLGSRYAYPYREKPLLFRRGRSLTFGRIDAREGPSAMPLLFDDPVNAGFRFEGGLRVPAAAGCWIGNPDAEARLLAGETPLGCRYLGAAGLYRSGLGLLNTDVNFLSDEGIRLQKGRSRAGYERLPEPYRSAFTPSSDDPLVAHERKIARMLAGSLVRVQPPEPLLLFQDGMGDVDNVVRNLCELGHGLPWNRVSQRRTLGSRLRGLGRSIHSRLRESLVSRL